MKVLAASLLAAYEITVSATVGEPKLTLYGYSSPQALVQLSGRQIAEQVISGSNGYFFFDRVFLPRPTPNYPELCLTAIDSQSRSTFPTCLPALPVGPFDITVGPVLLSPTLSLSKGSFRPGEQVRATGTTIPNTEVVIFLANNTSRQKLWSLIRPAEAFFLPKYQIKSDQSGHFEFNLPHQYPNNSWRVFASAQYQNSATPKSNTLTFRVLNWLSWLWLMILRLLKPYCWLITILTEVIIITLILFYRRRRSTKADSHSLRQNLTANTRLHQILSG